MMPRPGQTAEQYLHACQAAAGEFLARATPEQIEVLKAQGYRVQQWEEDLGDGQPPIVQFAWCHLTLDEFQDTEPSFTEADSWALAYKHATGPEPCTA